MTSDPINWQSLYKHLPLVMVKGNSAFWPVFPSWIQQLCLIA